MKDDCNLQHEYIGGFYFVDGIIIIHYSLFFSFFRISNIYYFFHIFSSFLDLRPPTKNDGRRVNKIINGF